MSRVRLVNASRNQVGFHMEIITIHFRRDIKVTRKKELFDSLRNPCIDRHLIPDINLDERTEPGEPIFDSDSEDDIYSDWDR